MDLLKNNKTVHSPTAKSENSQPGAISNYEQILPEGWPVFLAHRGASSLAPENSIAAYKTAKKLGAQGIELDVHLCKTGELVVTHDHWLDRIAGVHLKIESSSFAELSSIDIGSFFNTLHPDQADESFASERLATLDTVLETVGPDMYLDIELKSETVTCTPLAKAVATCLDRHAKKNCIISSFNPFALRAYRKYGTHAIAAIYDTGEKTPFYLRHREALYFSRADIKKPSVDIALGTLLHETGEKPVLVWTVDTRTVAAKLLAEGVTGIITNRIQDFI